MGEGPMKNLKTEKKMRGKNRTRGLGILCILAGLLIFLYPTIQSRWMEYRNQKMLEQWEENPKPSEDTDSTSNPEESDSGESEENMSDYHWIQNYNEELFRTRQVNFNNEAIVEQVPDALKALENTPFGFLEVPAMEMILPIYLGASEEHLALGAAVLGETSIPIGGESTNSVIAGHRGYLGMPYFRQIEDLTDGDPVYITNSWGRLCYRVSEIRILEPNDSDALRIREGEDMVTLLTCHPYRSNGKYRYAVFCRRDTSEDPADSREPDREENKSTESGGQEEHLLSSREDIRRETLVRKAGAGVIVLCLIGMVMTRRNSEG